MIATKTRRKKWKEGYELKENEYLLKIRNPNEAVPTGFISKYNKDGSIPKAFKDWGNWYGSKEKDLPIYIHTEEFGAGWQLNSWRIGKSQEWAEMIHPEGFTLEIYLSGFLDIVKFCTMRNGVLVGEYKWEGKKLIEKV